MNGSKRISLGLMAAALVASVGSLNPTATASTATDVSKVTGNVSSKSLTTGRATDARQYWTKQRMADAKPLVVRTTESDVARVPLRTAPTQGKLTSIAPAAGKLTTGGPQLRAYSQSRPYTDLPDRLNVKVFFTKATGGNYVCSGTIVNSASKRMVSTAGHCVSDGAGRWHLNVMVVPAYSSACNGCGDAPYGTWTARTLATTNQWHTAGNFKQDVGFIVTNDRNGSRIVNYLGGQGTRFNASRDQYFRSYGYPQAYPFNGFNQYNCPSWRLNDDNPNWFAPGPNTMRIACNMTGGASGGGWLVSQDSWGLGYVNSVNSYKYTNDANSMYGPYFGNEALSLYNFATSLG